MKILAVGNSFSQDASSFLHQAAAAQGLDIDITNLYIPGCPLEKHFANLTSGEAAYELQHNGQETGNMVSLPDMLARDGWDAIVTQQASYDSGWLDTYEPFLTELLAAFRSTNPGTRIALHETWAYDPDSTHAAFPRYHCDQREMFDRLHYNYALEARVHGTELIPSGTVIQRVRAQQAFRGHSLTRDGFHMSLSHGRYLLACVWIRHFLGAPAAQNPFVPESEEATDPALLQVIRETVDRVMEEIQPL